MPCFGRLTSSIRAGLPMVRAWLPRAIGWETVSVVFVVAAMVPPFGPTTSRPLATGPAVRELLSLTSMPPAPLPSRLSVRKVVPAATGFAGQ